MLKTMLFATCYAGNDDDLTRYRRYIDYYLPRLGQLGAQRIVLIDDGSDKELLEQLGYPVYKIGEKRPELPKTLLADVTIFSFEKNYGRPCLTIIPGWWRSFTFSAVLAVRYNLDKLIHIESDSYVLSDRMFEWIRENNKVWASPYTWKYWYAETAIQVVPRKKIPFLHDFWALGREYWFKNTIANIQYIPELVLPIEYCEKHFKGDRWGEDWYKNQIPLDADYTVNMGAVSDGALKYTHDVANKHTNFFRRIEDNSFTLLQSAATINEIEPNTRFVMATDHIRLAERKPEVKT